MHQAAAGGDVAEVRYCIEVQQLDVDSRDQDGDTPLHRAIIGGSPHLVPMLRYLISKNADVEAVLSSNSPYAGESPLMLASRYGKLDAVRVLLQEGRANANHTDLWGVAVLSVAAEYADTETIKILIQYGANINGQLMRPSGHPLICASRRTGGIPVMQALLEGNPKRFVISKCLSILMKESTFSCEKFRVVLDHCRTTMSEVEVVEVLLHKNEDDAIALHQSKSREIAKLLVEQPRRGQEQRLLPVCREQLVQRNRSGWTPYTEARRSIRYSQPSIEDKSCYLGTFESLALSISGDTEVECASTATKIRKSNHCTIAVRLNPALNDFQISVAQEAFPLVLDATGLADCIVHAIFGYLSPLDVMKRTQMSA